MLQYRALNQFDIEYIELEIKDATSFDYLSKINMTAYIGWISVQLSKPNTYARVNDK